MKRRSFVLSTGAIALGALRAVSAQPATRSFRVGIILVTQGRDTPYFAAMERRFRELGYIEGKNFTLDVRLLAGRWDKLPEAAAELAGARPDVVIATGSEFILKATRQAMGGTPIVMLAVDFDPVEKNHVSSLARPGGNITGVFFRQVESAAKRLELLKDALPKVTRVAALFDASSRDQFHAAEGAAKKLGITLLSHELRGNPYDFDAALAAAASNKAQAVLALSSGSFFPSRDRWIGTARKYKLPVITNVLYAEAGALVAFGPSFSYMYARAAEYADQILKGANPAEMPVEQPTRYELIVNMKTARALGIAIPQSLVLRADRVIE